MVFFCFFSRLVIFYLFGPLDSVYLTSWNNFFFNFATCHGGSYIYLASFYKHTFIYRQDGIFQMFSPSHDFEQFLLARAGCTTIFHVRLPVLLSCFAAPAFASIVNFEFTALPSSLIGVDPNSTS